MTSQPSSLLKKLAPYLGGATVFTLFMWLAIPEPFGSLGGNLFAGCLEAWFLTFVIDRVLATVEEERLLPARKAMLREADWIRLDVATFLNDVIETYVREDELPIVARVLEGASVGELGVVCSRFRMADEKRAGEGRPGGASLPWRDVVDRNLRPTSVKLGRFIDRYSALAPPELVEAAQELENSILFSDFFDGQANPYGWTHQGWAHVLAVSSAFGGAIRQVADEIGGKIEVYEVPSESLLTPGLIAMKRELEARRRATGSGGDRREGAVTASPAP